MCRAQLAGIIRDIMQNHLFQVLTLVAMEPPVTLSAEDIRNEKVKVLRAIDPLTLDRMVIGQYGAGQFPSVIKIDLVDPNGSEPSYRDDPGVPNDSTTPTYAMGVFFINNARWDGVPFILKCGKALNERKAEIRVQFKNAPSPLFDADRNELVIRIQPDEAMYWKIHTKKPGLSKDLEHVELNLSYKTRFNDAVSVSVVFELICAESSRCLRKIDP